MQRTIEIPDEFLATQIAAGAAKLEAGSRLITLRAACLMTQHRRVTLKAAMSTKVIPYYLVRGKPHFRLSDLWAWMDQFRVEVKQKSNL